jgi:uncharacterized repeat protein (TIGR01451 family)
MLNKQTFQKLNRTLGKTLRHHWLIALCVAAFVGIIWIGAPAWAAPVAQRGGTVPLPTATSEGDPIATATPQSDDEDTSDNGSDSSDTGSTEPANSPNIAFPQGPAGSTGGTPASNLTAQVNVNGLNLREGPGTSFNTLGSLPATTQVTVLSRSEDGAWWYICCIPGTETTGWASAQLLTADFDVAQANTLIPVFGTTPPAAAATPTPQAATQTQAQAALPLAVDFKIDPYFVWQGITATLTISVNNPNNIDAVNVLLSDELPATLTLVEATVDADGTVETVTAASGNPLLLFRWATIPADTAATATIVVLVSPDLADGEVVDNLVATRASNVAYSTSAVTIGMPPVVPPDFQ